jgi:hypothetical protein
MERKEALRCPQELVGVVWGCYEVERRCGGREEEHGLYSDPYCKMGISSAMPAPIATLPTSALTGAAGRLGRTPPPGATIAPWSLCTASTTKPCVAPGHATAAGGD